MKKRWMLERKEEKANTDSYSDQEIGLEIQGTRLHITGVVQGVGFRPFVYSLALRLGLTGWVRNTSAGVDIEVDGPPGALVDFVQALADEAPPLAHIDDIQISQREPNGFTRFEIVQSEPIPGAYQPISPDVSICSDCQEELFDPNNRRYRYPFINCTNCGPRFTIIKDVPYDRPQTTMASFELCSQCAGEYQDPLNRRFHAQPVACPLCGPHVWFEEARTGKRTAEKDDAIKLSRKRLAEGKILAIKGLGGFHLACDAGSQSAVRELRRRKLRVDKPFALMVPNLTALEKHAYLSPAERSLITSRERPIVILTRKPGSTIVQEVTPGQATIGVMLPYTPLHHLIIEPAAGFPDALVMTSGNLSEEPIVTDNSAARSILSKLADGFLLHDRDIHIRCDDSVTRIFPAPSLPASKESAARQREIYPLRRARGYAPFPVKLPWKSPTILAGGAELKNSFCLTRDHYAILSHHIGDMENLETLTAFEECIEHLSRLFHLKPEILAYDLHPDYLASKYILARAEKEGMPAFGVQHHHAHVASGMADHGLSGESKVIGISFDGTGYGHDGAIWGGEILVADYGGFERPYHLRYAPLPGGDKSIKEPWRMALAWLKEANIPWSDFLPPVRYGLSKDLYDLDTLGILENQLESGINCPKTSSIGRLFDAVASLAGVRHKVNYEAQAAIELEAQIDMREPSAYQLAFDETTIDPFPMLHELAADIEDQVPVAIISARFHNGLANMVLQAALMLRQELAIKQVVLSGGVWQNITLLARTVSLLRTNGFEILIHRQVPANDGGIALGQAVVAAKLFISS